jgi:hypothetical protein
MYASVGSPPDDTPPAPCPWEYCCVTDADCAKDQMCVSQQCVALPTSAFVASAPADNKDDPPSVLDWWKAQGPNTKFAVGAGVLVLGVVVLQGLIR